MARKGFWSGGINLLKELDRVAATTVYNGPKRCAELVVKELQEAGPAWTGKFSNSWQIETPTRTVKGTGAEGSPTPLVTPPLTGQQVAGSLLSTDKVIFRISNFSPYADQATDLAPFVPEEFEDKTPLKPVEYGKRPVGGTRGQFQGTGGNRRTADPDWFTGYARAGKLDKAVQITMDAAMRSLR
jgi:hypothetical protein